MAIDEGGLARRLWFKFRDDSVFSLYTPFFVGLASATLHSETTFRHFISQDLHFLKAFVLAYELAEDCADDEDDKNGLRDLRKRAVGRLQMHDTFVREWGFEFPNEDISKDIATTKYTDFLLATASGKIEGERSVLDKIATPFEKTKVAAYTLAALAPLEEFDYERLCSALEQLAEFERKANERVVQSGVLKGLNVEDIKRAGQSLILQDGCRSFFQKIVKNENLKTDVHVLSYCWCNDLIVSAFSSGDMNVLNVHSNELVYQESVTTGEIVKKMESPMEKLQVFNDVLIDCRSEGNKHLTVYIGGSVGDMLCLLEADIGIVVGSSSSLRRLGDHFGVSFVPLFSGLVNRQRELADQDCASNWWKPLSGVLYTVSSWAEIQAFILGT